MEILQVVPGEMPSFQVAHLLQRLDRLSKAGLIRQNTRDQRGKQFCINPDLPELEACCRTALERVLLNLADQQAAIAQYIRNTCWPACLQVRSEIR